MEEKVRVLIVDNEDNTLKLLTSLLNELNCFEITTTESPTVALRILGEEKIKVLITDQMMPEMKGVELLTTVAETYPNVIKILLTGISDVNLAMDAINKCKVFAYLNKPINKEQFFSIMKKVYETHRENEKRSQILDEIKKLVEDTSIGSYQIIKKIGEGGMADIYKAYDEKGNRCIALKIMKEKSYSPLQIERFKREALACEQVETPGIIKIFSKGEHNGKLYIVEEFLEGHSLNEWLGQRLNIDIPDCSRIALTVIRILKAIHSYGVIHRDMKPGNVFIQNGDTPVEQRIKILDFGIAKLRNAPQITQTGTLEGTVEFVAPESLLGFHEYSPAIDIYAFGIILYYLFFGESPYPNHSIFEIIQYKAKENFPIPERPHVPTAISRLIRGTTEKNIDDRLLDYTVIENILQSFI